MMDEIPGLAIMITCASCHMATPARLRSAKRPAHL